MSKDLFSVLLDEVGAILKPLQQALEDPQALDSLLECLNTDTTTVGDADLLGGLRAVTQAMQHIEELRAAPSLSLAGVGTGLDALGEVFAAARALGSAGLGTYPELGADLVELLTMSYLRHRSPLAFQIAVMLGLVQIKALPARLVEGGTLSRVPVPVLGFNFEQLQGLLTDPVATLRAPFPSPPLATVASANQTADLVVERIGGVLNALGVPWMYGFPPEEAMYFEDAAPFMDHALLIYAPESVVGKSVAGLCLALSSAERDDLGLVVTPFGGLNIQRQFSGWDFELGLTAEVQAFAVGGGRGLQLLTNTNTAQVQVLLKAIRPQTEEGPAFAIGAPDGTRLEVSELQITTETSLSEARQSLALSADVSSAAIVIAPGDGDGFLRSILPAEGLQAKFDLGLAWSNERGLTFRGAGSLNATLPIGLSIRDVLTVPTIHLSLRAGETGLAAEISASVGVSIGPVHVAIERVGIAADVTFPEAGGNLGVADLELHFKPPTGLGLVIDAPAVVGGGYLFFDPQKEEYSGILQLEVAETIAVMAIGLLTTRMPDGSKGFSLVVIMSAEGFAPIQLGFGFTLTGIGGVFGVNRTVMVDVLRSGLKNGTLGSILFPADPIRNAPQIVSDLRSVFPPVKDRYVFGPMALIAWGGTPPILTLEIGLILELPEPVRLIILGRLHAVLPNEDHALIQVRMDAIGVIDFNKGEVSLDATLYDSRILQFVLTGDMALRANWGAQPNFVLAIGGFNPRFPAPAGFPQLARLALSLADSDNPRLRFESYLALTSNTVQFGARLDFSYTAAGFTLAGFLGFDALFQFAPFQFIADVGAMVALKRGSRVLMGLFLDMTLAGPTPWHVWGKATFKVLFFKVSIRFDHRFGQEEPPALPEPIDVLTLLAEALSDRRNWSSALPRGEHPIVSLRDSATTQALRVHPLAELTVRQRVVPLNRPVTKFGNAPLAAGTTVFTVAASGIDNTVLRMPSTMVREAFALAQFQELSDEEKLTQPAFETQDAGLQFGVDEAAYQDDALLDTAIDYETLIIDPTRPAEKVTKPYVLPQAVLDAVVSLGAAGQAVIRRSGSSRYRTLDLVS